MQPHTSPVRMFLRIFWWCVVLFCTGLLGLTWIRLASMMDTDFTGDPGGGGAIMQVVLGLSLPIIGTIGCLLALAGSALETRKPGRIAFACFAVIQLAAGPGMFGYLLWENKSNPQLDAVRSGDLELLTRTVQRARDGNLRARKKSLAALQEAARSERLDMVREIVTAYAGREKVLHGDPINYTQALTAACKTVTNSAFLRQLIEAGADVNGVIMVGPAYSSPGVAAVSATPANYAALGVLLDAGMKAVPPGKGGIEPLSIACRHRDERAIQMLRDYPGYYDPHRDRAAINALYEHQSRNVNFELSEPLRKAVPTVPGTE